MLCLQFKFHDLYFTSLHCSAVTSELNILAYIPTAKTETKICSIQLSPRQKFPSRKYNQKLFIESHVSNTLKKLRRWEIRQWKNTATVTTAVLSQIAPEGTHCCLRQICRWMNSVLKIVEGLRSNAHRHSLLLLAQFKIRVQNCITDKQREVSRALLLLLGASVLQLCAMILNKPFNDHLHKLCCNRNAEHYLTRGFVCRTPSYGI